MCSLFCGKTDKAVSISLRINYQEDIHRRPHLFSCIGDSQGRAKCALYCSTKVILTSVVVGVPVDSDGVIVDDHLEDLIKKHCPSMFYTIPTFHNPTGTTLSLERRLRLLELAKKYNFLIVADEVYQLLHYDTKFALPPPFSALDNKDDPRVLSCTYIFQLCLTRTL